MTNTNTITGTVVAVERIGATVYGNPTYRIALRDTTGEVGIYRISGNASISYAITNPEYRKTPHTFTLTRSGRISGFARVAE